MSANVIYVDFSVRKNSALSKYLDFLKTLGLDADDILDVRDAILDYEFYKSADEDIKAFVDAYLNNNMAL